MAEANSNEQKCLFCGKTRSQVQELFVKNDGVICSECLLEFAKTYSKNTTNENTQKAKQYAAKKLSNVLDRVINRLIYKI